jgi:hypothetical protein
VKFALTRADGTPITPLTAPVWVTPTKGGLIVDGVAEPDYSLAPDSGFVFRFSDGQWIYNWGTSKTGVGSYWRIGVTLDDGTTHMVTIGLR